MRHFGDVLFVSNDSRISIVSPRSALKTDFVGSEFLAEFEFQGCPQDFGIPYYFGFDKMVKKSLG